MGKRLRRERSCLVLLRCRHTINHHLSFADLVRENRRLSKASLIFAKRFRFCSIPFLLFSVCAYQVFSNSEHIAAHPLLCPERSYAVSSLCVFMPRHVVSFLCHSSSARFPSKPFRILSNPCVALPPRFSSTRFKSPPFPLLTSPSYASPCPIISNLFCSNPYLLRSPPCLSFSFLCVSCLISSVPSQCASIPVHAPRVLAFPNHRRSHPCFSPPTRSLPVHHHAPPLQIQSGLRLSNAFLIKSVPFHFKLFIRNVSPFKAPTAGVVPLPDAVQSTVVKPLNDMLHQLADHYHDREFDVCTGRA